MKRYCLCFFIGILSVGFHQISAQEDIGKPIIVIDPGHGGSDTGAIGFNGIKEKEITLKIALEILRLNNKLFADKLEIYSTRYTDTLISLGDRTMLAKALNAEVFVSIHCNQSPRKEAQGVEVYIGQANRKSKQLARTFLVRLTRTLGLKNRGVKYGNFQVLRQTVNSSAVLLELGFLSNGEEAKHIGSDASIAGYALLIVETLIKFLNYD